MVLCVLNDISRGFLSPYKINLSALLKSR